MTRPPEPGERLRFGEPTFAAPRRRRVSTPPARVATPADLERLADRRAANLPDLGEPAAADADPDRLERLATRRAANAHTAPPEEQP